MSSIVSTNTRWQRSEHFVPDAELEPQEQRKLRGYLEQIDYTAHAANKDVLAQTLVEADFKQFKQLATATALARAKWVATAIAVGGSSQPPTRDQISQLGDLRTAYDELAEAYEALRRMVERGYLPYQAAEKP